MSSMDEDKELVERTIKGHKEAFEMIIRKYQQPVANYIGRMVGERELALDFTQEVFIKTYSALPSYRPEYKFSTWLFKIASNFIIDYWRKKKIDTLSIDQNQAMEDKKPFPQIPDNEPSIVRRYEMSELRARIENALEKTPAPLRELFVWRHINEFSYQEIAEIKDLPVGTIKNRVFQAKEFIRKNLEGKK
jgi:RNA polymerase sigma-70 factor (ECF subfamily)